jgi:hypothetical protein
VTEASLDNALVIFRPLFSNIFHKIITIMNLVKEAASCGNATVVELPTSDFFHNYGHRKL